MTKKTAQNRKGSIEAVAKNNPCIDVKAALRAIEELERTGLSAKEYDLLSPQTYTIKRIFAKDDSSENKACFFNVNFMLDQSILEGLSE